MAERICQQLNLHVGAVVAEEGDQHRLRLLIATMTARVQKLKADKARHAA